MKILIGGVDYAVALDAVRPLVVERKLNEPSTCRLWLTLPGSGIVSSLAAPVRNQELVIEGDDGTVYFTGYLAVTPLPEYVGLGLAGPVYRWTLQAASDEILLDTQLMPPSAGVTGQTVGGLLAGLVVRTGSTALETSGLTLATPVSQFVAEPGAKFSRLAGQVATQGRAGYRAMGGAVTVSAVGAVVHALDETDGTLTLGNLTLTAAVERALANDVTVCGADEPVAYVTEFLPGDGTTTEFPLTAAPYFGSTAAERVIHELFNEAAIDTRRWGFTGHAGYFLVGADGLTLDGGTGVDGQAALVWLDAVEAGGTLLVEASGVSLSPGSVGTVAGVYNGSVVAGNCIAGFAVTAATGTGAVSVAPLVHGVVAGPALAIDSTRQYTMRVRLHCAEVERITQAYRVVGDGGAVLHGGGGVVASARVAMDVQEIVDGVSATPVVLYDGQPGLAPGTYQISPASSVNLIGTMRSFIVTGQGSGWVTGTTPGGTAQSRRLGTVAQGGECHLTRTGLLTFYAGYAPAAGETVTVSYRTVGRAVGRAVNEASQAALGAAGSPATAVWTGTVTEPSGRSSQDCRNAAQALVTAATSVSGAWSGTYKAASVTLDSDVWPGDALLLTAPSVLVEGTPLAAQVVVRAVALEYRASVPDVVGYAITFSNDWANDLAIRTSQTVPEDAWLPAAPNAEYLGNLNGLTVTAISATAVTVAANATAPAGGGFEVRRRDFAFQAGTDADLVLRTAVPNFDIPRAAEAERFYVRMYDAGTPPKYSEFSAALFVNLPL